LILLPADNSHKQLLHIDKKRDDDDDGDNDNNNNNKLRYSVTLLLPVIHGSRPDHRYAWRIRIEVKVPH